MSGIKRSRRTACSAVLAACFLAFTGCTAAPQPESSTPPGDPLSTAIKTQTSGTTVLYTTGTHGKETIFTQQTTEATKTIETTAATEATAATTTAYPRPTHGEPQGDRFFSNLTHNNAGGKMGDCDGPAFCVYSKKGYNRASMDILLSDLQLNVSRRSDGLSLTAYIFLGVDVYDDSGRFVNCFDAGLGYDIGKQKWVLFYNILHVEPIQQKWYMSSRALDTTHDYRLVLDTSQEDGWATMILYDLTAGGAEYDRASFRTLHTRKDGHNTVYYQDYALDFPDNVKYDTGGQPAGSNWPEITLYNTDENVYMKNLKILNVTINDRPWTADKTGNRAVWPDCTMAWIDYPVVAISRGGFDSEWQIDIDMNHRENNEVTQK